MIQRLLKDIVYKFKGIKTYANYCNRNKDAGRKIPMTRESPLRKVIDMAHIHVELLAKF